MLKQPMIEKLAAMRLLGMAEALKAQGQDSKCPHTSARCSRNGPGDATRFVGIRNFYLRVRITIRERPSIAEVPFSHTSARNR
jgi:hypothetical protein